MIMKFEDYQRGHRLEGFESLLTYQDLGGQSVSAECIISELSHWPLDGILGFLASLSLEMVQNESFFAPPIQGSYLNLAIVDDFPATLPAVSELIVPGRVPDIRNHRPFIHEQNLAWLSHQALIHSLDGQVTEQLEHDLKVRTCRLLLMANDFFSEDVPQSVEENISFSLRRDVALSLLRRWQFDRFQEGWTPWLDLARECVIMLDYLPEYFDVESAFINVANGITLQRYYEILVQMVVHIYQGMSPENRWIDISTFCSQLESGADELMFILSEWTITPEQYRFRTKDWRRKRTDKKDLPVFDFVQLLKTPLIEARPGELVCPVIPFLLKKIVDGPYFKLSDHLPEKERTCFHNSLGKAYERYANSLVERIANGDSEGRWKFKPNPENRGNELADAYLQKGAVGVTFEHKRSRLHTDFLLGAEGERVLGPSENILKLLDTGQAVELQEGKYSDQGLITKPMWQQSIHADDIKDWAATNIGVLPETIYAIISHYANVRVDEVCRVAYLQPLIKAANLYAQEFLDSPQWLYINELEFLASLADENILDLESLLLDKSRNHPNQRFDIFLQEKFQRRILDVQLLNRAEKLIGTTRKTFWPSKGESFESEG